MAERSWRSWATACSRFSDVSRAAPPPLNPPPQSPLPSRPASGPASAPALAATIERNRRNPEGTPDSHIGIALHYGTVSYGNIGTDDRLDFTVIGPDVNLVSRIERLCRELDRSLIMTEAFIQCLDQSMWELGAFELRGFSRMQRLFELPHED